MIYCIDIDGTICQTIDGDYKNAVPIQSRIDKINQLHEEGNTIIFLTARGSVTHLNHYDMTRKQLDKWGVVYDKIMVGKPYADRYIDDKGISDKQFFND